MIVFVLWYKVPSIVQCLWVQLQMEERLFIYLLIQMNMLSVLGKTQLSAPYIQGQPFIPSQNPVPFNQAGEAFFDDFYIETVNA